MVPADFERRRFDGREAVQVLVDGSDTVVQSAAIQLARVPLDTRPTSNTRPLREGSIAGGPISVTSFYNPQRRSAVNIVPGLIGVILTMTLVMFTAVAVVRERERGNMELLIATPVSRSELMVGKVLLCSDRPAADHPGAGAGYLAVPGADPRQPAGHLPGRGPAGAGQPGAGPADLHARVRSSRRCR